MSITKIIGYCRISTGRQERSGLSMSAQEEEIRKFAQLNNLEVVDIRFETASGKYPLERRPVLSGAFDDAERIKGCAIVAAKLDRLSREVDFIASLMKKKTPFFCVDCGLKTSSLELHIRAVVAYEERRKIAERTSAALQQRIANGLPVGFDLQKNKDRNIQRKSTEASISAVKQEADAYAEFIKEEIMWRKNSGMTMVQIADSLNKRKVATRRGGKWYAKSVYNVMQRWNS